VRNERSLEKLSDADLHRLVELARLWQQDLERRKPHWRLYEGRLLCVCLAQGAALHLIDGTNGIKDFDVYRFFAASPERPNPDPAIYRGRTTLISVSHVSVPKSIPVVAGYFRISSVVMSTFSRLCSRSPPTLTP
jgi:hypothetical protein